MMAAPRNNPVIAPPTDAQPKVLDGFCDFIVPPPGGRSDGCGSRVGVATAGLDDGNSVELYPLCAHHPLEASMVVVLQRWTQSLSLTKTVSAVGEVPLGVLSRNRVERVRNRLV